MTPNTPTDEPDNHIPPAAAAAAAPPEAPKKQRSGPRPLADKLSELADSARHRVDRLRTREHKLVTELGKVRGELQAAKQELQNIVGAARGALPPDDPALAPAPKPNGAASEHAPPAAEQ